MATAESLHFKRAFFNHDDMHLSKNVPIHTKGIFSIPSELKGLDKDTIGGYASTKETKKTSRGEEEDEERKMKNEKLCFSSSIQKSNHQLHGPLDPILFTVPRSTNNRIIPMVTMVQHDPSAFDLLVCCPSPLSRSQVHVDFSPVYDRQPHPDGQLEQTIDKVWKQRIAAQPSLFSASKFRYGGFEIIAQEGAGDKMNVVLRLGLTDYKTFIGTNLSPEWEKFAASETDDAGRCKYTADPLGNGAIVETTDRKILILQRSMDVGEFPGYIVFPGGHSEPEELGINSHSVSETPTTRTELNNRIAQEMFDGIIREIVEETGVPPTTLSDPVFIGVSRRKQNVRPTAFFHAKCSLTSAEVMEVYRHAEHSFESTVLLSCSPDELLEAAGTNMPGCHHGGAVLYQMMRKESTGSSTSY